MIKTNKKYKISGDYGYKELPVSAKELSEARKKAAVLAKKDINKIAWRSCWVCNRAHVHFLRGKWGDWILNCFECGRYYYDKIDITGNDES